MDLDPQIVKYCQKLINQLFNIWIFAHLLKDLLFFWVKNQIWPKVYANLPQDTLGY
jgi:hypothetical protein